MNTAAASKIVLIKKIPYGLTNREVDLHFNRFGKINAINILNRNKYAYVEFETHQMAKNCVDYFSANPLVIGETTLNVFLTKPGKKNNKPLDFNSPSKIVLLTFFKNKCSITVKIIRDMLKDFDLVKKIIIYEKSNIQALVELSDISNSSTIKDKFNEQNYKGLFQLRVQYTSKTFLAVNPNSPYEFDGELEEKKLEEEQLKNKQPENTLDNQTNFLSDMTSESDERIRKPTTKKRKEKTNNNNNNNNTIATNNTLNMTINEKNFLTTINNIDEIKPAKKDNNEGGSPRDSLSSIKSDHSSDRRVFNWMASEACNTLSQNSKHKNYHPKNDDNKSTSSNNHIMPPFTPGM